LNHRRKKYLRLWFEPRTAHGTEEWEVKVFVLDNLPQSKPTTANNSAWFLNRCSFLWDNYQIFKFRIMKLIVFQSRVERAQLILNVTVPKLPCGQFHQCFTRKFYVQKSLRQLFLLTCNQRKAAEKTFVQKIWA